MVHGDDFYFGLAFGLIFVIIGNALFVSNPNINTSQFEHAVSLCESNDGLDFVRPLSMFSRMYVKCNNGATFKRWSGEI